MALIIRETTRPALPDLPPVSVLSCTVSAWMLTLATGGTAVFTAWSLSSEPLVQIAFAAVATVMTVMLVVVTDEAGRQQTFSVWLFFIVLFAVSLWCSVKALEFSATAHQTGLPDAEIVRWTAAIFLDGLRAGCVWLGQSIKARIESEERRAELKAQRDSHQNETMILPSWDAQDWSQDAQDEPGTMEKQTGWTLWNPARKSPSPCSKNRCAPVTTKQSQRLNWLRPTVG